MTAVTNDIPRRNRMDLMTTAELAITGAMHEVEKAGADVRLTDAVTLLGQARDKVADFVDGVPASNPAAEAIASDVPTIPGTPFCGGFYAGRYIDDGKTYAMVVAPKALGEIARIVWKKNWREPTPGAQSLIDGYANTQAMLKDGSPAAEWVTSLRIGGKDDWCLPARDQLELLRRNFKPGTDDNWTYASRLARYGAKPGQYNGVDAQGNGHNASSVPPGDAYTAASPAQTIAEAFREGGAEAFERAWYWSSTGFGPADAWVQFFVDGFQTDVAKYGDLRARAVRKVLI